MQRVPIDYARARRGRRTAGFGRRLTVYTLLGLGIGIVLFAISVTLVDRMIGALLFPWTTTAVIEATLQLDPYSERAMYLIVLLSPLEYAAYGMSYALLQHLFHRRTVVIGLLVVHLLAQIRLWFLLHQ
jgi:hypothetical protein